MIYFSDAVIAIAITLLVLDLQVPSGLSPTGFTRALGALAPQFFSFGLSFLVIGRFWISHHRLFRYLRAYDEPLLSLNLMFLLSIAFLPFPTAQLGDYPYSRAAALLYAVSIASAGLLLSLLWAYMAYGGLAIVERPTRRVVLLNCLTVPVVFGASVPLVLAGQTRVVVAIWIFLPPLARLVVRRVGAA